MEVGRPIGPLCIMNYTQQGYRCMIHDKKKREDCVSIYIVSKTYSSRKRVFTVEESQRQTLVCKSNQ